MLRRPIASALLLFVVYACLALLMDPGGYLGTDTGAKVYTLEVMDRAGTSDPDVGYWAEDLDPSGRLHPLYQTRKQGDSWVAVTTLPMIEVARPLYALGGYRLTLVLPILGAVGTAYASRKIAGQLEADDDASSTVFWVVGLASPIAVYALDFWEHSLGVGCMVGALALLLGSFGERWWARAVPAGALLGAAAVLRNETFVYAAAIVGVLCAVELVRRRSAVMPVMVGLATVVGFAGPWFANVVLERSLDGQSRAARVTGTSEAATSRAGSEVGLRVEEGLRTLLGQNSGSVAEAVVLGAVVVGVLFAGFRAERRGDRTFSAFALTGAAASYAFGVLTGLGFISGMLLAFPLAVAGFVAVVREARARVLAGLAIGALPVVYAFQYLGGAGPQWGGRYTLTSGVLLGIVGFVTLRDRYPTMIRGLVALSFAVTLLGVSWLGVRSRSVDSFFEAVQEDSADVVIARQAFLIREGGAAVVDERWLSTKDEATFALAVDIAREIGEESFTVLEWNGEAPPASALPGDVEETSRVLLEFADVPVGMVTYDFTS